MRDLEDLTVEVGPITVGKPDKDGAVMVTLAVEAIVIPEKLDALGYPLPSFVGDEGRCVKKIVTTGALGKGGTAGAHVTFRDEAGHPVELDADVAGLDYVVKEGLPYLVAKLQTRRDVVCLDTLAALVDQAVTFDLTWLQRELDFGGDIDRNRNSRKKAKQGKLVAIFGSGKRGPRDPEIETLLADAAKREQATRIVFRLADLAEDPERGKVALGALYDAVRRDPDNTALSAARDFLAEQLRLKGIVEAATVRGRSSRRAAADKARDHLVDLGTRNGGTMTVEFNGQSTTFTAEDGDAARARLEDVDPVGGVQ
jgi:hypothetical protein